MNSILRIIPNQLFKMNTFMISNFLHFYTQAFSIMSTFKFKKTRNILSVLSLLGLMAASSAVFAESPITSASAPAPVMGRALNPAKSLRQMQIHKLPALGLSIWTEDQPEWIVKLDQTPGKRPSFQVQSPEFYHPPTAMIYTSFRGEKVSTEGFPAMAKTAIQYASLNFGLKMDKARTIPVKAATYGVLKGFEGDFVGFANGTELDVKVFIAQEPGKFPIALNIYTVKGKMSNLSEVIRRGWGNVSYLE
jgi:hypothetical protein